MKHIAVILFAVLAGCASTETIHPDGTITRTKSPAPGSGAVYLKALEVIANK